MSNVINREVFKPEKICLCRECGGTGHIESRSAKIYNVCPQCGGQGRVRVSAHISLTIKPF